MGRGAVKAQGNVWYQARIEAAKYNEKLSSREGAAEEVGMSEDAIKNTELGLEKCMPVDKAVLLADLYNAPELLNYYCLNECPIGKNHPLSDKVVNIERITVKLLRSLNTEKLEDLKERMIQIAGDGEITKDEIEDLDGVISYLDDLSTTVSELRILARRLR